MAVELAEGYGWVILALVANILVTNAWMPAMVIAARQKYKVPYPIMYATESDSKDAKAFNCVQRGHQNTMELQPAFLSLLVLGGFQYPLIAAVFGALYTVGRIQYFRGYSTGRPSSRYDAGARVQWVGILGVLFCTVALALHQFIPTYV